MLSAPSPGDSRAPLQRVGSSGDLVSESEGRGTPPITQADLLLFLTRKATELHTRASNLTVALLRQNRTSRQAQPATPPELVDEVDLLREDAGLMLRAAVEALNLATSRSTGGPAEADPDAIASPPAQRHVVPLPTNPVQPAAPGGGASTLLDRQAAFLAKIAGLERPDPRTLDSPPASDVQRQSADAHQAPATRLDAPTIASTRLEALPPERADSAARSARRAVRAVQRGLATSVAQTGHALAMTWRVGARHLATVVLAALVVAVAALLTPLPELFGWQLLAVQSGSMEPTIPLGSAIAIRPARAADLRIGDVITFADRGNPNTRVTHRIVSLDTKDGRQAATTKGDANTSTDSWDVPLDQHVGRVMFHLPYLGYAMVWLALPPARLAALGAVLVILGLPALFRSVRRALARRHRATAGQPRSFEDLAQEIETLLASQEGKTNTSPETDAATVEAPPETDESQATKQVKGGRRH